MPQERTETNIASDGRLLQVGQEVDRYVVESVVGSGGTATVYRVAHRDLGTVYALKVLTLVSPSIRRRTLQEGRVQAALKHRNIVAVYDVLEVGDAPGLLMEFVEGPSLELALERYNFSLAQAEVLFRGVLEGVREAHGLGLVHRDLKPANVMLADTPKGVVPKVTDFGIAKVVESEQTGHTRAGVAMGTPQYMSPEQIRDAKSVDQRADIFSMGCLLYELVTHRRAFPHEDIVRVYNAVCDGDFVPPREYVPDLPARIENAILGCLKVERDARIPDCDVLRDVFEGRVIWGDDDTTEVVEDVSEIIAAFDANDPSVTYLPQDLISQIIDEPDDLDTNDLAAEVRDTGTLSDPSTFDEDLEEELEERAWVPRFVLALALLAFVLALMSMLFSDATLPTEDAQISQPEEAPRSDADAVPASGDASDEGDVQPDAATPAPTDGTPKSNKSPRDADVTAKPQPTARPTPRTPAATTTPKPTATVKAEQTKAKPAPVERIVTKLLTKPFSGAITVDGQSRGLAPQKLQLTPGKHAVRVQSGGVEHGFHIDVQPGAENKWCFVFESQRAVSGNCP